MDCNRTRCGFQRQSKVCTMVVQVRLWKSRIKVCTSLALPICGGRHLFGRTLDLEAHFGEGVILTPRRYSFSFADCYPLSHHYALLGMGMVMEDYPLYAEAMNEKGLCMAGLRFAKSAVYADFPQGGRLNLAP